MKALLKIAIPLALLFASTFIVAKMFGFLSIDQIRNWLELLKSSPPILTGGLVAFLLFLDLFIAVPTLTLTVLSGYFLGFAVGSLAALVGSLSAGIVGYWVSRKFGHRLVDFILKDEKEKKQLVSNFETRGFVLILLSRAMPILPEVTACLAGLTKMKFCKFLTAWLLSTLPYTFIATYSGSISSVENPKPAIITALGLSGALWVCWYLFGRIKSN